MVSLSILIPTYNRCNKILRLLKIIDEEMYLYNTEVNLKILVSDNHSSDKTEELISNFKTDKFEYNYYRQNNNLGFDGNVDFLYQQAKTDYIWFIADDDIPLPGSIKNILNILNNNTPDVLFFSFIQPPDPKYTRNMSSDYSVSCNIITNPPKMVEYVSNCWKLSTYVLKKVLFNKEQDKELKSFLGNEFYFKDLAFSILSFAANPKLCYINQPLATCDKDYLKFEFTSRQFLEMYKVFNHSFVTKHLTGYAKSKINECYQLLVGALFSAKSGSFIVADIKYYDKMIKELPVYFNRLITRPDLTMKLILMKLNLVKCFDNLKSLFDKLNNIKKLKVE